MCKCVWFTSTRHHSVAWSVHAAAISARQEHGRSLVPEHGYNKAVVRITKFTSWVDPKGLCGIVCCVYCAAAQIC